MPKAAHCSLADYMKTQNTLKTSLFGLKLGDFVLPSFRPAGFLLTTSNQTPPLSKSIPFTLQFIVILAALKYKCITSAAVYITVVRNMHKHTHTHGHTQMHSAVMLISLEKCLDCSNCHHQPSVHLSLRKMSISRGRRSSSNGSWIQSYGVTQAWALTPPT